MHYYDIKDDFEAYPDAFAYLCWSKRGPGKTYSTLRFMIEHEKVFLFIKRTIDDVEMLCTDGSRKGVVFDVSPFKPLNRDFGWNYKPVLIKKSVAGIYKADQEGKAYGTPVGYVCALSDTKTVKGFDMSEVDYMVFDEFIPRKGERVSRSEGEQLLSIYMTVRRDRMLRGKDELKLVCLANAEQVNNPVFMLFDVVDFAVDMDMTSTEYKYLKDKKILLHFINAGYAAETEKSAVEIAMSGTEWADMAFGGHFAYDDFTNVHKKNLKGYKPVCSYEYKKKITYVYVKDGWYHASRSAGKMPYHYDLSRENQQKKFYYDFIRDLRAETIEDRFTFEKFTDYDLIVNYKKIFDL